MRVGMRVTEFRANKKRPINWDSFERIGQKIGRQLLRSLRQVFWPNARFRCPFFSAVAGVAVTKHVCTPRNISCWSFGFLIIRASMKWVRCS
jgi:hypothetical protein